MTLAFEVEAKDLVQELEGDNPPIILDVREPAELQLASLPYCVSIPLATLYHRWQDLKIEQKFVVMCHHGYRSLQATLFLVSKGFLNIRNLKGGIEAWSVTVDASVPRY